MSNRRRPVLVFSLGLCLCLLFALAATARADTLTLSNGDQFSGDLTAADAGGVVFHNAIVGDLHVAWKNIRLLTTTTPMVVLTRSGLLRGLISARGDVLEVLPVPPAAKPAVKAPGAAATSAPPAGKPPAAAPPAPAGKPATAPPVSSGAQGAPPAAAVKVKADDLRAVLTDKAYADVLRRSSYSLLQGWQGNLSAGFSLVSATQSSRSYTGSANFRRNGNPHLAAPPTSATLFSFQGTYGSLTQPGEPTVLTSIYSAALEQDENLNSALFLLGRAQLDHNIAQGLRLQQSYGGGLGWKPVDNPVAQLDLKAGLHFTHQVFLSAPTASFLAADFSESYRRRLPGSLIWTETVGISPAVTQGNAYQSAGTSALVFPVYKKLSFNLTVVDSYLGNPQPGFRHNSLQFSSGLQYSFQ